MAWQYLTSTSTRVYAKNDLFFFTSIAEGTPHVILEAIGNNLPILCFDTCGQGDCVNKNIGIKIPLSNPQKSTYEFASILNNLEKIVIYCKACPKNVNKDR